uniref:Zinc finger matrin-type protein 5 n=1 Tax=Anser brachyrhynchus TaxID=132585 RepID=A0A8B9C7X4_9AVES
MGKRYFCDYCDRSFQDNLHNRKKHLNGVQHLRAKRAWYDLFRDAAAILQEEQSKKPCRKFLQTGQCDFGSNCRFSHMTEQDLEKLSAQVQGEQRLKELRQEGADVPLGTIEDWLEKRAKRLSAAQSNRYRGLGASQGGGIPREGLGTMQVARAATLLGTRAARCSWHPRGPARRPSVAHLPRGHVHVRPHGVGGEAGPAACGCSPGEGRQRVPLCPWQRTRTCLGGRGGGGAELLMPAVGDRRLGSSVASSPILCLPCLRISARPCLLLRQAEGGISSSSRQRDACLRVPAVPSLT